MHLLQKNPQNMHLYAFILKWSKYVFACASMQMHNYPKPNHYILASDIICLKKLHNICLYGILPYLLLQIR